MSIPSMPTKPDLGKLIAEAEARFRALAPADQLAHCEAQRKSWVVGETMLEHPEMTREQAELLYDHALREFIPPPPPRS